MGNYTVRVDDALPKSLCFAKEKKCLESKAHFEYTSRCGMFRPAILARFTRRGTGNGSVRGLSIIHGGG
jgi:hypothetical protein